jgi:hypothetical protein
MDGINGGAEHMEDHPVLKPKAWKHKKSGKYYYSLERSRIWGSEIRGYTILQYGVSGKDLSETLFANDALLESEEFQELHCEMFKLQRPLAGRQEVLVYNEDKSILNAFPYDDYVKGMFGNMLKIYVDAFVMDDGKLAIIDHYFPDEWPEW